jgi:cellulose synthase/poly-beta-1,6-N-acetylglucosamine synthase-like glycosyltransferase
MINIIITSYNEPKATLRAVDAFLKQDIKKDYKIIVCDPFPEVEKFLKNNIKDRHFEFFLDPGEGKSYALNLLIEMNYSANKEDIFIFTDGDVYVSENAVSEIISAFKDPIIGCVTCKPVPVDDRNTKFGYWAHLLFSGIDRVRKKLSRELKFFECSGYLFAIRNGVIKDFPLEVSEDSVIPYLFWNQGYKIKYLDNVEVYVKNPEDIKDWELQKIRNIKGHENLNKIYPDMPRTKTFYNEIKYGLVFTLLYPRKFKEILWTSDLFFKRYGIYKKAFKDIKKNTNYSDGWRENETKSTKPLD